MRIQIVYRELDIDAVSTYSGGYTFECSQPVGVGDLIEVDGQTATVIALGSDYDGEVRELSRVLVLERRSIDAQSNASV